MELSQHGIVLTVEESGCFQAKVFLKRELFVEYDGAGMGGSCFRLSLGLLVDCLNIFSALGQVVTVEIWYPSPNMRLLLNVMQVNFLCLGIQRTACRGTNRGSEEIEKSSWVSVWKGTCT